jgi:hypothetical protein
MTIRTNKWGFFRMTISLQKKGLDFEKIEIAQAEVVSFVFVYSLYYLI